MRNADGWSAVSGTPLALSSIMAMAPATKGVLFTALLVTISALFIAARMLRLSGREIVAPEAWSALADRDAQRAANLFREALNERPLDPALHFGEGSAAFALGRTTQALASLRRAVELDPQFPEARRPRPGRVRPRRHHAGDSVHGEGFGTASSRPRLHGDPRSPAPRVVSAQQVCRTDGSALPHPLRRRHKTKCR